MANSKSKFTVTFFLKVLVLLSLIFIFSYVNARKVFIKKQKEVLQKIKNKERLERAKRLNKIKENHKTTENMKVTEGMETMENFGNKDDVECQIELAGIIFIVYDVVTIIYDGISFVLSFLVEPIGNLLKELLGDFYDYILYPVVLLGHLYKFTSKVIYKLFYYVFKFLTFVIELLSKIIFRIMPRFILDILSYVIAVPYLLFIPIADFLQPVTKYFNVVCWKKEIGLIGDIYDNLDTITDAMVKKFTKWNDTIIKTIDDAADEQKERQKKKEEEEED